MRARTLRTLGLALGLARPGEIDRSEQLLGESVSLCDALSLRPLLAQAWAAHAELYRHCGQPDRAAGYAQRAAREFEACGMPAHATAARRLLED